MTTDEMRAIYEAATGGDGDTPKAAITTGDVIADFVPEANVEPNELYFITDSGITHLPEGEEP